MFENSVTIHGVVGFMNLLLLRAASDFGLQNVALTATILPGADLHMKVYCEIFVNN